MSDDREHLSPSAPGGDEAADPYREFFERSADAILIIEGETFVECNQATVKMLRCEDRAEVLRTHPSELSPPTQPDGRSSFDKANEMIAMARERGSHRFEWDHRRADGEVFPVEVLLTAVQRKGKSLLHVVWRDISERKELENQLRHSQKMDAIGKLAGGIAHDFNNLLVAIIGHAELLGSEVGHDESLKESVDEIRRAGGRAADLVRQLLAFSRKQDVRPRVFDLRSLTENLKRLLVPILGEQIRLRTPGTEDQVLIRADPGQIEQVIVNLVTNARDAMPRGGVVSMEVKALEVGHSSIGLNHPIAEGRYSLLSVSDTGSGMDEATLRQAFDPFFTTKEIGKGTGLGLATVYGIVEQNQGVIDLISSPGQGTTVKIYFPVAEGEAPQKLGGPRPTSSPGGSETLLVAEDETAVSALIARVLEAQGYEVLLARDGHEALDLWKSHSSEIHLLLTDVVMPRMGGVELVAALRADGFDPPLLYVSGYTNEALAGLYEEGEEIDLLEKPFSPDDLVDRVRKAIDLHRRSD